MPQDDAWDWPLLLYVGTVMLKMPERKFWKTTPRKLNALSNAHIMVNSQGEDSDEPEIGFIDEIF